MRSNGTENKMRPGRSAFTPWYPNASGQSPIPGMGADAGDVAVDLLVDAFPGLLDAVHEHAGHPPPGAGVRRVRSFVSVILACLVIFGRFGQFCGGGYNLRFETILEQNFRTSSSDVNHFVVGSW